MPSVGKRLSDSAQFLLFFVRGSVEPIVLLFSSAVMFRAWLKTVKPRHPGRLLGPLSASGRATGFWAGRAGGRPGPGLGMQD